MSLQKFDDHGKSDSETQVDESQVDVALGIFEQVKDGHVADVVDEKALLRKIDLRMMPLMYVNSSERGQKKKSS